MTENELPFLKYYLYKFCQPQEAGHLVSIARKLANFSETNLFHLPFGRLEGHLFKLEIGIVQLEGTYTDKVQPNVKVVSIACS